MDDVTKRAMAWLTSDDTGMSSEAICAYMLGGAAPKSYSHPSDPSDLGRCLRLLERIPEWKPRMGEMAQHGPYWAALVPRWDDLAKMMDDEVGIDWKKGREARKTYAFMDELLSKVRRKDSSVVDFGNGMRIIIPEPPPSSV